MLMFSGIIGAIVRLSPPEAGSNIWKATQTDVAHNLPPVHDGRRKDISWMFGPVVVCSFPFSLLGWVRKNVCAANTLMCRSPVMSTPIT